MGEDLEINTNAYITYEAFEPYKLSFNSLNTVQIKMPKYKYITIVVLDIRANIEEFHNQVNKLLNDIYTFNVKGRDTLYGIDGYKEGNYIEIEYSSENDISNFEKFLKYSNEVIIQSTDRREF